MCLCVFAIQNIIFLTLQQIIYNVGKAVTFAAWLVTASGCYTFTVCIVWLGMYFFVRNTDMILNIISNCIEIVIIVQEYMRRSVSQSIMLFVTALFCVHLKFFALSLSSETRLIRYIPRTRLMYNICIVA